MKSLVLLVLFISTSIFGQVEHSGPKSNRQFLPKFYIDLASYESENPTKTKVDVFIKVPYSNVQFLRTNTGYLAKYSLVVSLFDDDELVLEKLWNEKIESLNFKQTASESSFNISYKSFDVVPGKYKFVCRLEDRESRKFSTYNRNIHIRKFSSPIEVSDVVIVSEFVQTDQGLKVIPSISNLVTSSDSSLSFFYEIYSKSDQTIKVQYAINDVDGKPLYFHTHNEKIDKGRNEINKILDGLAFSLGDYQLEVKLLDKNDNLIRGSGKKFSSKIPGIPASVKDLDLAIKQMQYIAPPTVIGDMEDIPDYNERLLSYLDYWKQKDPSPNTIENEFMQEYYRRVEYANAHFKGYFKGWKSDMGMVYITLGAPDQVTRRPYEMDSRPYEVWEYYTLNRNFVFVDNTNFGDYRLQNPTYGDWFRYRP